MVNSQLPEYLVYHHIKKLIIESGLYQRVFILVHPHLGERLSYWDAGSSRMGNLLTGEVDAGSQKPTIKSSII